MSFNTNALGAFVIGSLITYMATDNRHKKCTKLLTNGQSRIPLQLQSVQPLSEPINVTKSLPTLSDVMQYASNVKKSLPSLSEVGQTTSNLTRSVASNFTRRASNTFSYTSNLTKSVGSNFTRKASNTLSYVSNRKSDLFNYLSKVKPPRLSNIFNKRAPSPNMSPVSYIKEQVILSSNSNTLIGDLTDAKNKTEEELNNAKLEVSKLQAKVNEADTEKEQVLTQLTQLNKLITQVEETSKVTISKIAETDNQDNIQELQKTQQELQSLNQ